MEDKENAVFITPLGTFCMEVFMFVLCFESVVCLRFDWVSAAVPLWSVSLFVIFRTFYTGIFYDCNLLW